MIDLAVFLKRNGYRPDQVQDFIPAPFDVATAMYHTGIDPFTGEPVFVARHLRDRKLQRALMQFFKPENYFEVRRALLRAGRPDLIGGGGDALIPANPPREAILARRRRANPSTGGEHVHAVPRAGRADPAPGGSGKRGRKRQSRHTADAGYRPQRKSTTRPR
jgi:hypothetical protein